MGHLVSLYYKSLSENIIGSAKIYPYLTDFQGSNPKFSLKFSFGNLGRLNSLIHELVGIIVYRMTGRTNSFFPDLDNIPINQS